MTLDAWTMVAAAGDAEVWRGPGAGPALVIAHGIEDSWTSWGPLVAQLPGYTPYALKLPWHSGSSYAWRADGTPVEWLRRTLELVPEPPAVLLGHSFGGIVLLSHLADLKEGHDLTAVVLVAPAYRPAELALSDDLRNRTYEAYCDALRLGLGVAVGPRWKRMDPEIRQLMEQKLLDRAVPASFPMFYEEYAASGNLDLAGIDVPVLVLAGAQEAGMTPECATALEREMPAAKFRLRPSYGHFCHMEQAGQLAEDINEFLTLYQSERRERA